MHRFRFRLEKVREVKKTILDLRQRDLAAARRVLEKETRVLDEAREEARRARATARQRICGGVKAGEMAVYAQYLSYLDDFIRIQQGKVWAAGDAVEKCRMTLLEAHKESKILDRLKDKQIVRHLCEFRRAEQVVTDEIAAGIYVNKGKIGRR